MWMFIIFICFEPSVFAANPYSLSYLFSIGGSKYPMPFTELENWNYAISYGVGSTSPLSPSFIFSLELARSTQVCFYIVLHIFQQESFR
jgi:hypothetical protein